MSTFQLLKSGASFRPERVATVAHLFTGKKKEEKKLEVAKEEPEAAVTEMPDIDEIDKELEKVKNQVGEVEKTAKGGSKKVMKQLEDLQTMFKHIQNKRREALISLNKRYKIKVEGAVNEHEVPDPVETFEKMQSKFGLSTQFIRRLKENECLKPTPVQMQTIPLMYHGHSAVVLAETGSGKSLAFITPLLHKIKHGDGLKAIVLSPTRELTIQLYKEFLIFASADSKTSPRVKFMRKALYPKNEDQFK